jgi:hypothetical protein
MREAGPHRRELRVGRASVGVVHGVERVVDARGERLCAFDATKYVSAICFCALRHLPWSLGCVGGCGCDELADTLSGQAGVLHAREDHSTHIS